MRINLKDYKQGLNASKFSLLLNQFFINTTNFVFIINEILLNNYPINFLNLLDNNNDYNFKLQFKIVITKKGSNLSTTSHFLILPKEYLF